MLESGSDLGKSALRGMTPSQLKRLTLRSHCGEGAHSGCVNRLAWNTSGSVLASASDDLGVKLWRGPHSPSSSGDRAEPVASIDTGHAANIFGLSWLDSSDGSLATGAMDAEVRVHSIEQNVTRAFCCHSSRVKAVCSSPSSPNLLFSASEDGTVRLLDLRCNHHEDGACRSYLSSSSSSASSSLRRRPLSSCSSSICIGIGPADPSVQPPRRCQPNDHCFPIEAKGLSINPVDPNKLAVACGDAYVRVFDLRAQHSSPSSSPQYPLRCVAPPHLAGTEHAYCSNATSVSYSRNGRDIAVHYHKDHVYVIDVSDCKSSNTSPLEAPTLPVRLVDEERPSHIGRKVRHFTPTSGMTPEANRRRLAGNRAFATSSKGNSVRHYGAAISLLRGGCTKEAATRLLLQRATASLRRNWVGDAHGAYLDCEAALYLDPNNVRANVRRVQALQDIGATHQARDLAGKLQAELTDPQGELDSLKVKLDERVLDIERRKMEQRDEEERRPQQESMDDHEPDQDEEAEPVQRSDHGNVERGDNQTSGESHNSSQNRNTWEGSGDDEGIDDDDLGTEGDESAAHSRTDTEVLPCTRLVDELRARSDLEEEHNVANQYGISDKPCELFQESGRVRNRLTGACNVHTDIKEATFVGEDDRFVAAGSDDGRVFVWDRLLGDCVNCFKADQDIVNCVQPDPTSSCIATSGIEHTIRFWAPGSAQRPREEEIWSMVEQNQKIMAHTSGEAVLFRFGSGVLRRLSRDPRRHELLRQVVRRDEDAMSAISACSQS